MDKIIGVDWQGMFQPTQSLLEIFLRGTITYWAIFLLMRFFRRGTGQLGISDVLLIILIADAAQNSMAGEYNSISEGVTLIATLVLWDLAIDWLSFHSKVFNKFAQPRETLLIKNGVLQKNNMKKQLITEEDLFGILREQGIDDVALVKSCCLEGSGNISIIRTQNAGPFHPKIEKAV
jgi:uncharacterized membrane protein YcaP (DUF421 family)